MNVLAASSGEDLMEGFIALGLESRSLYNPSLSSVIRPRSLRQ
jgi:hypothetical protein